MSGASASEGELAVDAMVGAARQIFEAMRQGDDPAMAGRVEQLHAEYEQQWARVRQAAAAFDEQKSSASAQAAMDQSDPGELEALLQERRELRGALTERNRQLKEQIDRMRELLCAVQLSGGS